ncbi:DUF1049 domain-containing protein [Calothrix sp. NIES-3974]|uniref:DUF1049 domain-containing protein n=1 Tax=Calothrix sp. NIES-3974 TaxID=2005462 RepID=UPI000B60EB25|nr:DUF1049 domain-containing protein [Calothrix sp. NIES-3974]BAZ03734.1 hypothetical protein NIES3974_03640 [Calothrix sp. NIES-3974]
MMNSVVGIIISLIVAIWVSAIAIIAFQNPNNVSLKFLGMESIQLPFGVLLSFCASGGMVGMAILELILRASNSRHNLSRDDDPDFFTDDEVY